MSPLFQRKKTEETSSSAKIDYISLANSISGVAQQGEDGFPYYKTNEIVDPFMQKLVSQQINPEVFIDDFIGFLYTSLLPAKWPEDQEEIYPGMDILEAAKVDPRFSLFYYFKYIYRYYYSVWADSSAAEIAKSVNESGFFGLMEEVVEKFESLVSSACYPIVKEMADAPGSQNYSAFMSNYANKQVQIIKHVSACVCGMVNIIPTSKALEEHIEFSLELTQ